MGKHEVTQGQWKTVMGSNPAHFQKGDDYPVEQVSWNDAREFIARLQGLSEGGYTLRLPTEAEWEYACRSGGEPEMFSGGDDVEPVAWYADNSAGSTRLVNAPNGLGLIDMSGNVWEWCEDTYDSSAYSKHQRSNPVCSSGSSQRVVRGGSWTDDSSQVRCGIRRGSEPDSRNFITGFRLVRTRER
jgi:formylglycine-generating enzyme required for sulfatase activity